MLTPLVSYKATEVTPYQQFVMLFLQFLIWLCTDTNEPKWKRRFLSGKVLTQLRLMAYCTNSNMPIGSR